MNNCTTCKEQEITNIINKMGNYTIEELELAIQKNKQSSFTKDEIAWYYNLYNRVFQTNKQPGCAKCFSNIRKHLQARYDAML